MKKRTFYPFILSSVFLLASCGNSNQGNEENSTESKGLLENISEATGAIKSLSKLEEYTKEMENSMNELKQLTPVSNDVLKVSLPSELGGLKRSSFNVGEMSAINISNAKAEYKEENSSKRLSLEIMDGAGEGASSIVSLTLLAMMGDKEQETQDGFEKTIDLNGNRAVIKENSYEGIKNSEIQWIHDKRFVITLKGDEFPYEELAAIQQKLDLSSLK